MQPDERYCTVNELSQGQKFIYNSEQYMRLPDHVECYGCLSNAINVKTGMMIYIASDKFVDLSTMIVE